MPKCKCKMNQKHDETSVKRSKKKNITKTGSEFSKTTSEKKNGPLCIFYKPKIVEHNKEKNEYLLHKSYKYFKHGRSINNF